MSDQPDRLRGQRFSGEWYDPNGNMRPPGSYGQLEDGTWWIVDPAGSPGLLRKHAVIEHDDGTITVAPSIWDAPDGYHGWLERGFWRDA